MVILLVFIVLAASLIWGDWSQWRKYHATILYFIMSDWLYNMLTYEYPLWSFASSNVIPTHTLNNLLVNFVAFPAAVIFYLSRYPKNNLFKQGFYILGWVAFSAFVEWLYTYVLNLFTHSNGWNLGWSVTIDVLLFLYLKLHYEKPLTAYLLTIPAALFYIFQFKVPVLSIR